MQLLMLKLSLNHYCTIEPLTSLGFGHGILCMINFYWKYP